MSIANSIGVLGRERDSGSGGREFEMKVDVRFENELERLAMLSFLIIWLAEALNGLSLFIPGYGSSSWVQIFDNTASR